MLQRMHDNDAAEYSPPRGSSQGGGGGTISPTGRAASPNNSSPGRETQGEGSATRRRRPRGELPFGGGRKNEEFTGWGGDSEKVTVLAPERRPQGDGGFSVGDHVLVQRSAGEWSPGVVTAREEGRERYEVDLGQSQVKYVPYAQEGHTIRREGEPEPSPPEEEEPPPIPDDEPPAAAPPPLRTEVISRGVSVAGPPAAPPSASRQRTLSPPPAPLPSSAPASEGSPRGSRWSPRGSRGSPRGAVPQWRRVVLRAEEDEPLGLELAEAGGEVWVATVTPGGAAEDAGVQVGDVVVAVDGQGVTSADVAAQLVGESFEPCLTLRFSPPDPTPPPEPLQPPTPPPLELPFHSDPHARSPPRRAPPVQDAVVAHGDCISPDSMIGALACGELGQSPAPPSRRRKVTPPGSPRNQPPEAGARAWV
eukprot:Hpha_TRINITY_DN15577_c2_g1::TRINITY_DN15577_c2_g1_i1::g.108224::m.108224